MQNRQLSPIVVEMLVALADHGDVSPEALCDGLPVDELSLRSHDGLEWDVAVEFLERLEARVGAERLRELAIRVPDFSPMGRRILGRFVSPGLMLRFVFRAVGPTMYPMYDVEHGEQALPDGSVELHVRLRLREGFRECQTMFDLHGISTAALPAMLGKPPVPYRATTSGRGGEYWFSLR